jgi:hypothetical protein
MRKTSLLSLLLVLALQTTAQTPNAVMSKTADRKFADAPSDANRTPLDATLTWIKHRLSEDSASQPRPGYAALRFEPVIFSGCRIKYRYTAVNGDIPGDLLRDREPSPVPTPPVQSSPAQYVAPPTEYTVNLTDLKPEPIIFHKTKSGSEITFATLDLGRKISEVTFNDQLYRGEVETRSAYVSFRLKKTDAAPYVRNALVHAIKLCQAQP